MAKQPTCPTLYDEVLQIHLSKLKQLGYFALGQIRQGKLSWSGNGGEIASISIRVNAVDIIPYIELKYIYRDESRHYQIRLDSIPSNLGKGRIWYFLCPKTKKRCRKLYLIDGYFLHREAFNGCMYDCQTKGKHSRKWNKTLGALFEIDQHYEELYSKHFKTHYNGKPTKRYIRIMNRIEQKQNLSEDDIKRLLY